MKVEEQFESSRRFLDEWLIQLRDPGCFGERNVTASQHSFQACHVRAESRHQHRHDILIAATAEGPLLSCQRNCCRPHRV